MRQDEFIATRRITPSSTRRRDMRLLAGALLLAQGVIAATTNWTDTLSKHPHSDQYPFASEDDFNVLGVTEIDGANAHLSAVEAAALFVWRDWVISRSA